MTSSWWYILELFSARTAHCSQPNVFVLQTHFQFTSLFKRHPKIKIGDIDKKWTYSQITIMMYVYISIYHNYLDWKSKESSCNFFRFPQVFCHLLLFWSSRVFAFRCLLTNLLYFSCPWWRESNKYSFVQINTSKELQLSKSLYDASAILI